jgi:hypothetical protein
MFPGDSFRQRRSGGNDVPSPGGGIGRLEVVALDQ